MKYVDEFRDRTKALKIARSLNSIMPERDISIMEVCGTHTHNFYRFGIDKMLPKGLELISGPGCPVCVSPQGYIDNAIKLSRQKDIIILTFGDMLRVPGKESSLEKERSKGAGVHIIYSPLDCLKFARQYREKRIVFLAVGFETTAPAVALTIEYAKKEKINNLFFLASLKGVIPAVKFLLDDKRVRIDGFLLPGHVSSVIGTDPYGFIPEQYGVSCCVSGFEPLDILESLYLLIAQINSKRPRVDNQYMRAVSFAGNKLALKSIKRVFSPSHAQWRGLGRINNSGFRIRKEFSDFDAEIEFGLDPLPVADGAYSRCRCADILKGLKNPKDCSLFKIKCTPEHPFGPCMISSEGACNAYYKYQ